MTRVLCDDYSVWLVTRVLCDDYVGPRGQVVLVDCYRRLYLISMECRPPPRVAIRGAERGARVERRGTRECLENWNRVGRIYLYCVVVQKVCMYRLKSNKLTILCTMHLYKCMYM